MFQQESKNKYKQRLNDCTYSGRPIPVFSFCQLNMTTMLGKCVTPQHQANFKFNMKNVKTYVSRVSPV